MLASLAAASGREVVPVFNPKATRLIADGVLTPWSAVKCTALQYDAAEKSLYGLVQSQVFRVDLATATVELIPRLWGVSCFVKCSHANNVIIFCTILQRSMLYAHNTTTGKQCIVAGVSSVNGWRDGTKSDALFEEIDALVSGTDGRVFVLSFFGSSRLARLDPIVVSDPCAGFVTTYLSLGDVANDRWTCLTLSLDESVVFIGNDRRVVAVPADMDTHATRAREIVVRLRAAGCSDFTAAGGASQMVVGPCGSLFLVRYFPAHTGRYICRLSDASKIRGTYVNPRVGGGTEFCSGPYNGAFVVDSEGVVFFHANLITDEHMPQRRCLVRRGSSGLAIETGPLWQVATCYQADGGDRGDTFSGVVLVLTAGLVATGIDLSDSVMEALADAAQAGAWPSIATTRLLAGCT